MSDTPTEAEKVAIIVAEFDRRAERIGELMGENDRLKREVAMLTADAEVGYSVLPGIWAQCVVDAGLAEFTAGAPDIQHHQRIRWTAFDDSNPLPQEDPQ